MKKLWIDLETRARVDLRVATPYRYAEDPDFRILMAAWSDNGRSVQLALHDEVDDIPGLWDPKVKKVAHNAAFERICLSRHRGLPVGTYLPVEEFHDTQAIAGVGGWPQGLDKLAKALGVEEKDSAGTRLINLFCKPNRKGGWNGPDTHPLEWLDFCLYCAQDVHTLIAVDRRLGGFPTEAERAVYWADQAVNDAGIRLDLPLARRAVRVARQNAREHAAEFTKLTGVANPSSNPQVLKWFRSRLGEQRVPNLQKDTVEELLSRPLEPDVQRALELRQELALVASKKFSSALASVSGDGRLRGGFRYYGAHTGRWAGRGTQLHNLPRAQLATDDDTTLAILDLELGLGASAHTLKALVRSMFILDGTVVDYSAIEARVIAWLAGERWALEAFRRGRDIYVETAERMGGLSRSQGKVAVLALGYQGAARSLRAMAGGEFYIDPVTKKPIQAGSLAEAGKSKDSDASHSIVKMTDEQLVHHYVKPWRAANRNIVNLWYNLERAFVRGGQVGQHLTVEKDGNNRLVRLPSGRALVYHDVHNTGDKPSFWNPRGWRQDTYGGKLAENATQAVARDLLAEGIVRLQEKGFTVVGHVHDEVLVEGEHLADVNQIMVDSPAWAAGLPVAAEGFTTYRYKKG